MRSRVTLIAALVAAALQAPSAAAAPLTTGVGDPLFDAPGASSWLDRAKRAGARDVRVTMHWRRVAPAVRPAGFDAASPASPGYDWAASDGAIRDAAAKGLRVLLLVSSAPDWAEGPGRPDSVNAGAWRPDAAAFGAFMRAVATRYSGAFDPGDGRGRLPRVAAYQLWNEPNLSVYLAPQWELESGRQRPRSPAAYKALVNAGYAAVKAASPRALVVGAGTAPYGDPVDGGLRMAPARFARELLCLRGTAQRPRTAPCAEPLRLDVLAHHPYGIASPTTRAAWPDDVTLADLSRLTRAWGLAQRTGRLLPRGRKQFWVTEFGWESKPDPRGLTEARQATWLAEGLAQMHRHRVSRAFWYRIHDDLPRPSWGRTVQSGLHRNGGAAKRAAAALRFPVAVTGSRARRSVFALPPASGTCVVQHRRRAGAAWRTAGRGRCRARSGWTKRISVRGGQVRVRVAGRTSPVAWNRR